MDWKMFLEQKWLTKELQLNQGERKPLIEPQLRNYRTKRSSLDGKRVLLDLVKIDQESTYSSFAIYNALE